MGAGVWARLIRQDGFGQGGNKQEAHRDTAGIRHLRERALLYRVIKNGPSSL